MTYLSMTTDIALSNAYVVAEKAIKVCDSSTTLDHAICANEYVTLAIKKIRYDLSDKNINLAEYLVSNIIKARNKTPYYAYTLVFNSKHNNV